MEILSAIIQMLGGLAMFLYGIEVMGDGLKNSSGDALKRVLEKVTGNLITGVLTGALVTAVIQSSTATIVLAVALIGAGVLTLKQAVSIVMGANIGTTITAWITNLAFMEGGGNFFLWLFDTDTLAPIALFLGIVLIMFVKTKKAKTIGDISMGFGILFIGLMNMTGAVKGFANSPVFMEVLASFSNSPILGIIAGLVLTVIVQSSSATVAMLQSLSATGAMDFSGVYPIIMGINIGTCIVTAFYCFVGESHKDSRRTGLVHVVFNTIGTIAFMIILSVMQHIIAHKCAKSIEKFDVNVFEEQEKVAFSSLLQRKVSFPIINYMGIYEIEKKEKSVSVMCDRARVAISTVKGEFHKRVAYYDNKLRDKILYRQELIGELETALKEEQFVMYLQPQVDEEGKMLGAEALIRWIHPKKGFIPPGDFIPVFEENGLICDVDRFIWETACKQLRKWKDEGREELYISVNISPKDFYFLNVYEVFSELVEKYDINPKNLKIEITETAVVMDLNRQLDLIERLRQNGFVVEMDDFGSGYSSLNMLKDIHVDVLKIDMAFLKKAEDEERSKKILQMIIALSDQLDMPVITEGVESQEQVEFLKKMGCHIFYCYYFAKPMDVETFERTYLK